jgi:serine/threonine protein kinase
MTTPRPDPRLGTELGPYRIEAVIGRGGMGVVYLAEQARLGRKVALKIVSPEFSDDPKARARFLRESQMAAAIDHPNILPIYEADEADGVLFIAMRLVEGTDLAARLAAGHLDARTAAGILSQVAGALDAAHARGLVHRDVKPANILLSPGAGADQGDHAYLTDFGLTKRGGSETSLTAAGGFAGTLAYIAPEQVDGREIDGRADQYSLACMAFECLTGRVPFVRETDIATAMAHIKDPPPSALALQPTLPAGVDGVLARGMAKAPDDRYPTCGAFLADLRGALGLTANYVAPVARPTWRRSPVPWIMVAGIAVALLVGLGVWVVGGTTGVGSAPSSGPTTSEAVITLEPSPTEDAYPNAAEAALLATLPDDLAATCARGSYKGIDSEGGEGRPLVSLACTPLVGSGVNLVEVRRFPYLGTSGGNRGFTTEAAISGMAPKYGTIGGDCAKRTRVNGRWNLGGEDAGAIICYRDPTTGDAVLWWSYKNASVLVKAVNQRGEAPAVYTYFDRVARFIQP